MCLDRSIAASALALRMNTVVQAPPGFSSKQPHRSRLIRSSKTIAVGCKKQIPLKFDFIVLITYDASKSFLTLVIDQFKVL